MTDITHPSFSVWAAEEISRLESREAVLEAEIAHLTASPLPQEIEVLVVALRKLVESVEGLAPGASHRTLHGKAATALEGMARENSRLRARVEHLEEQILVALGERRR
jgi:hypothetical protein